MNVVRSSGARRKAVCLAAALGAVNPSLAAAAQARQPVLLPPPTADPLAINPAADPVLQIASQRVPWELFRSTVAEAVVRHPATLERTATTEEARAARAEAQERRLPSIDLSVSSYRVIAREFSNDPDNILERSRPANRTDARLNIQQNIFDFGASAGRVEAAGARLRAAAADAEAGSDRIALTVIAAWYDVVAARALVAITGDFATTQQELRAALAERIRQGVSAAGDAARVESYIASTQTRAARFQRLLANAEARFQELTGTALAPELERPPVPDVPAISREAATAAAINRPEVRGAQALANAARLEAKATRADRLPQISAGIDAGRFGVLETERDYDIRGQVTLRQRLFGGTEGRVAQAEARVRSAEARASRLREEAGRDASIAWSDVQALEEQRRALAESYIASRRSRDLLRERFVNFRGDLLDVVAADDAYFQTATAYIQALTELDAARYVLLSRTGQLLVVLGIDLSQVGGVG